MGKEPKLMNQSVYYDGKFCLVNSVTHEGDIETNFTLRDLRTDELYFNVDRSKFLTTQQLNDKIKQP